jgi:hypothetical protein
MGRFILALAVGLSVAAPAHADPSAILETATFVPSATNEDLDVWIGITDTPAGVTSAWIGARFDVAVETRITEVGLANMGVFTAGTMYAVIVRVPEGSEVPAGGFAFPDGDVMAQAAFATPTEAALDARIPLPATLPAGRYMVIFGSGRFGTFGSVHVNGRQQQAVDATFVQVYDTFFGTFDPRVDYFGTQHQVRMLVIGQPEHESITEEIVEAIDGARTIITAQVGTRASQASLDALAGRVATAAAVNQLQATVNALAIGVGAPAQVSDVQEARAALTGEIQSRASQQSVDDLAAAVGALPDASLQTRIEIALATRMTLATLFLPNAAGGHLDDVRAFVDETIGAADRAGMDVRKARADLLRGDQARGFQNRYAWYVSAYQRLLH